MELGGEEWHGFMPHPFIGIVIDIYEKRFPLFGQSIIIKQKNKPGLIFISAVMIAVIAVTIRLVFV